MGTPNTVLQSVPATSPGETLTHNLPPLKSGVPLAAKGHRDQVQGRAPQVCVGDPREGKWGISASNLTTDGFELLLSWLRWWGGDGPHLQAALAMFDVCGELDTPRGA